MPLTKAVSTLGLSVGALDRSRVLETQKTPTLPRWTDQSLSSNLALPLREVRPYRGRDRGTLRTHTGQIRGVGATVNIVVWVDTKQQATITGLSPTRPRIPLSVKKRNKLLHIYYTPRHCWMSSGRISCPAVPAFIIYLWYKPVQHRRRPLSLWK